MGETLPDTLVGEWAFQLNHVRIGQLRGRIDDYELNTLSDA